MFTGLILELGQVVSLDKKSDSAQLSVRAREVVKDARLGDSIAVNGVCLTVVEKSGDVLLFDVSYETLKSTGLGSVRIGDKVNIEPSLLADSRLGGHFVTGHVDAVGTISSRKPVGNAVRVEIEAPEGVLKYLVEKGSVAVDGISLTVVDVFKHAFSVVIIPHTAGVTTIGFKKPGDKVNLESDILAKYVAKFLQRDDKGHTGSSEKGVSDATLSSVLKRSGFIG
jgi:riboflavin synthase